MKIAFGIVAALIVLCAYAGHNINSDSNTADDRMGAAIFYMIAMAFGVVECVLLLAMVLLA